MSFYSVGAAVFIIGSLVCAHIVDTNQTAKERLDGQRILTLAAQAERRVHARIGRYSGSEIDLTLAAPQLQHELTRDNASLKVDAALTAPIVKLQVFFVEGSISIQRTLG